MSDDKVRGYAMAIVSKSEGLSREVTSKDTNSMRATVLEYALIPTVWRLLLRKTSLLSRCVTLTLPAFAATTATS